MYKDDRGRTIWNNKGASAICEVQPLKMMEWLRHYGVYTSDNIPTQSLMKYGFWVVKKGQRWPVPAAFWTVSGLEWLRGMTKKAIAKGELKAVEIVIGDDVEIIGKKE